MLHSPVAPPFINNQKLPGGSIKNNKINMGLLLIDNRLICLFFLFLLLSLVCYKLVFQITYHFIFFLNCGPAHVSFVSKSLSTSVVPISCFPHLQFSFTFSVQMSSSSCQCFAIMVCAHKSGLILHLSSMVYKSSQSQEHWCF